MKILSYNRCEFVASLLMQAPKAPAVPFGELDKCTPELVARFLRILKGEESAPETDEKEKRN